MRTVISRQEAEEAGLGRYFTGEPCRHGHVAERYTQNGICVQCSKEYVPKGDLTPCSVEGCDKIAIGHGMCRMHYQRWYRNGGPTNGYFGPTRGQVRQVSRRPRQSLARSKVPALAGTLSRQEAQEAGLWKYFTGVACPRGHVAERYTRNDGCIQCAEEAYKRRYVPKRPPIPTTCSAEGCDRRPVARGMCGLHYRRWYSEVIRIGDGG
jgi:hypothetical protein